MKIFDKKDLNKIKKQSWDYENNASPEDDGIIPLAETDEKIEIMVPIIVKGIAYTIGSLHGKVENDVFTPRWGIASKMEFQEIFVEDEEAEEQNYTDDIVCPYCGHTEGDSWECSDEEDEHECVNCGSIFSYQREVTVNYCSQPVKKAEFKIFD